MSYMHSLTSVSPFVMTSSLPEPTGWTRVGRHICAGGEGADGGATDLKPAGLTGEEARSSFLAEVVSQLAQLLKDSGFGAALRDRTAAFGQAGDAVAARQQERQEQLRAAGRRLVLAALLASACFTGHLAHVWPGMLPLTITFLLPTNPRLPNIRTSQLALAAAMSSQCM